MPSLSIVRSFTLAILAFFLIAVTVSGCTVPVTTPQSRDSAIPPRPDQTEQLVEKANTLESPAREQQLLEAAQGFVDAGRTERARAVLENLDTAKLDIAGLAAHTTLYAAILTEQGEYFRVRELLTAPRLAGNLATLAQAQRIELYRQRGELFSLLGELEKGVNEFVLLSELLSDPEAIRDIHERIWLLLSQAPDQTLSHLTREASSMALRGWYDLAQVTRSAGDVGLLRDNIAQWRQRWPGHPAILFPPTGLDRIESAANTMPVDKVALLVPLEGSYGQAGTVIRNGVLAAHFDNLSNGGHAPALKIYDTSTQPIERLYQQAIDDGAAFVIGPLRRENLLTLAHLPTRPVTIIGLNYLEAVASPNDTGAAISDLTGYQENAFGTNPVAVHSSGSLFNGALQRPNNLYQFGLSIVDEVRQVAQRMWLEGHRSVLIIAPDADWGEKARSAFTGSWNRYGGRIVSTATYGMNQSDFTSVVKPALLIDHSIARAKKIQHTLGKNIEYRARRRHDIDAIFLVAQPAHGRSIKPTLDFFYAHDLPVYATSHLYTGIEDTNLNRDLDGIRFSAMPWTLPGMVSDHLLPDSKLQSSYRHLYALGIDAYQLHQRLGLMQASPEAQFYGHTGVLTVSAEGVITRRQPWAEFRRGRVRPAPTLTEN